VCICLYIYNCITHSNMMISNTKQRSDLHSESKTRAWILLYRVNVLKRKPEQHLIKSGSPSSYYPVCVRWMETFKRIQNTNSETKPKTDQHFWSRTLNTPACISHLYMTQHYIHLRVYNWRKFIYIYIQHLFKCTYI